MRLVCCDLPSLLLVKNDHDKSDTTTVATFSSSECEDEGVLERERKSRRRKPSGKASRQTQLKHEVERREESTATHEAKHGLIQGRIQASFARNKRDPETEVVFHQVRDDENGESDSQVNEQEGKADNDESTEEHNEDSRDASHRDVTGDLKRKVHFKADDIWTACRVGDEEYVRLVIWSAPALIHLSSPKHGDRTPLYMACHAGHARIVALLLEAGAEDHGDLAYQSALNDECRSLMRKHRKRKNKKGKHQLPKKQQGGLKKRKKKKLSKKQLRKQQRRSAKGLDAGPMLSPGLDTIVEESSLASSIDHSITSSQKAATTRGTYSREVDFSRLSLGKRVGKEAEDSLEATKLANSNGPRCLQEEKEWKMDVQEAVEESPSSYTRVRYMSEYEDMQYGYEVMLEYYSTTSFDLNEPFLPQRRTSRLHIIWPTEEEKENFE